MSNQEITQESKPGYFTVIPNIIDDSDLDPFERTLLIHYYRVGNCWQGTKTTAKICNMSMGTVSKKRRSLAKKGWIRITEPKEDDPLDTIKITVVDKWAENFKVYAKDTPSPGETPPSPGETPPSPGETPPSPGETPPSPGETKNNPIKNNPIKNIYMAHTREELPIQPSSNGMTKNGYIHPDPEPISSLKVALTKTTKTALYEKTEDDYDSAAYFLFGNDATPESVAAFGEWWKANGYYPGKPALKSLMDEWANFAAGVQLNSPTAVPAHLRPEGRHDELPPILGE